MMIGMVEKLIVLLVMVEVVVPSLRQTLPSIEDKQCFHLERDEMTVGIDDTTIAVV